MLCYVVQRPDIIWPITSCERIRSQSTTKSGQLINVKNIYIIKKDFFQPPEEKTKHKPGFSADTG